MLIAQFVAAFVGGEVGNLIQQTGPVAKIVLLILLGFSLFSWAIILAKWSALKRARAQSGRFVRAFRKATRLQDVAAVAEQFKPSPLVGVFENAYDEYRRQGGAAPRLTAIQRATQIAASEEMTRLERRLPWLATTGAVTPFIGLFGTVWGIIDAFQGLGTRRGYVARGSARHFRSADHDRRRPVRRHSGGHRLQRVQPPNQGVRGAQRRFLPGVAQYF